MATRYDLDRGAQTNEHALAELFLTYFVYGNDGGQAPATPDDLLDFAIGTELPMAERAISDYFPGVKMIGMPEASRWVDDHAPDVLRAHQEQARSEAEALTGLARAEVKGEETGLEDFRLAMDDIDDYSDIRSN